MQIVPRHLMVRYRILIPFIEVRILAGHPLFILAQQKWYDSIAKLERAGKLGFFLIDPTATNKHFLSLDRL
jgi:hypothetical protein